MMQYTGKYWNILTPWVKKSLKRHHGSAFAAAVMRDAKPVYRDLLNRMDDIGAKNPMASNVYMSFVFFAVYLAAKGKLSVDDLRVTANDAVQAPIMKIMGLMMNLNRPSCMRSMDKMMHQNAEWLEQHPQYKEKSWDFNFDAKKHRDGFYYHFTQCPLNNFARREGLLDVLPVMCDMDHETAKLMHAKLHRAQTLASGGSICDYWYVGDKTRNPK